MHRVRFTLRRIFCDWRIWLLSALLFGLFALSLIAGIGAEYRYRTFYEKARFAVQPDYAAGYLDLEGHFESMEQVWAAYVDSPELAEHYYLSALCAGAPAGALASILFSFWIIGRGLTERHASELLLRGAGRGAAFRQLLFPYLGAALLLRWGFFALCFAVMPIHTEYFTAVYFRETAGTWLLLSAAETAFFGFTAFALPPFAALGADLGAAALALLLPSPLGRLLPLAALNDKTLWKTAAFPGALPAAAFAGGAILLASVSAAWFVFRGKDLE